MTMPTPHARRTVVWMSAFVVAFLTLPTVNVLAGTKEAPEITDPSNDVDPTSARAVADSGANGLLQPLSPALDQAMVKYASLYDIRYAFVSESAQYFFIDVGVQDIPDAWSLPALGDKGTAASGAIASQLSNTRWEDLPFDATYDFNVYFHVKGTDFVAKAKFGELSLSDPTHSALAPCPDVARAQILQVQVAAQSAMATLNSSLQSTVSGVPSPTLDTLQARVTQAVNDLTDLYALTHATLQQSDDKTGNDGTLYAIYNDTIRANVISTVGTLNSIATDNTHALAGDPVGAAPLMTQLKANASWAATTMNNTLSDDGAAPCGNSPPEKVFLVSKFTVNGQDAGGSLVDPANNTMRWQIAKSSVGSPARGDMLTKFRAEATFKTDYKMDFAPDARSTVDPGDPTGLAVAAASGQLVQPQFGRNYQFQLDAPANPGGSPTIQGLVVSAQGPKEAIIEPGGHANYVVSLHNTGTAALSGLLALSSPIDCWQHQLGQSTWSLAPGSTAQIGLTVAESGAKGCADAFTSKVFVTQTGGQTVNVDYRTLLKPESAGGGPDAREKATGAAKVFGMEPAVAYAGMSLIALLAVAAIVMLVVRHRRRR